MPFICVTLIACSKYENGPDFSLQPKKERITNNWTVAEVIYVSGKSPMNFQATYVRYQFRITGSNNYSVWYQPNGIGYYTETGEWTFSEDKTHSITTNASGKIVDYHILKLEKNQLWIRYTEDGNEWELHLWPKSDE